jgi:hypothetical protein
MCLRIEDAANPLPRSIGPATLADAVCGAVVWGYDALSATDGMITDSFDEDMAILKAAEDLADHIATSRDTTTTYNVVGGSHTEGGGCSSGYRNDDQRTSRNTSTVTPSYAQTTKMDSQQRLAALKARILFKGAAGKANTAIDDSQSTGQLHHNQHQQQQQQQRPDADAPAYINPTCDITQAPVLSPRVAHSLPHSHADATRRSANSTNATKPHRDARCKAADVRRRIYGKKAKPGYASARYACQKLVGSPSSKSSTQQLR